MGVQTSKGRSFSRVPKYDLNHFGVITVIFNPLKYKSRYELYHKFDEHMSRSKVTLLTVECIFDSTDEVELPRQKFEITSANDPRHLQIRAPSVLWLKENLINIAVKRLPADVEYVAWLDADIEFERLDWAHLAIHQLQHYSIVQLFELSSFLGPGGKKQVLRQDYSFAYAVRHDQQLDARRSSECYVHPGYGWAMRRAVFEDMGGLLDFSILGSGDIHFAYALVNRIEETIPHGVHDEYRTLAKVWGQRVAQLSRNGTSVGYVPVHIWHYWHGNRVNRGYFERWNILKDYQFAPLKDLEKNDHLGLIRLTDHRLPGQSEDAKRLQSFEKAIVSYFRSRNEDSLKKSIPAINTVKLKSASTDVVRPTSSLPRQSRKSWTTDVRRTPSDSYEYTPLHHTHSGLPLNAQPSVSPNTPPDLPYHQSAHEPYPQGHHHPRQDLRSEYTYSDDENRTVHPGPENEISF